MAFKGSSAELHSLFCEILGCHKPKPKIRLHIKFGPDEPIPHKAMKLTKVLKPGFRRPFTLTPDEPVDINDSGTYVQAEILDGDSTVTIDPASTATSIKGWLNGDGALGDKAIRLTCDGHIGEGVVQVSLDIEYTVATPDATALSFTEGADEPIPA